MLEHLKKTWKHDIPEDYEVKFIKAFLSFKFPVIFDPFEQKQKHMNTESF